MHIIHLEKGDSLIKEGDASTSMYWLQSGSLRLFKKKGQGFIELGVVHTGEVVGELSFLDNEPRSASVEALQHCDIVEIPRGNFDKVMVIQPKWLSSLVQTLVKRLRTTNNRLREVESNSTVYVQDEDGKTSKIHEFLSTKDILKLCSALVLVASRNSEVEKDGSLKVRAGWLQVQAGHILGVPIAKIQSFTDALQEAGFIKIEKKQNHVDIFVTEMDLLERFMYWLNEEQSRADDKQMILSSKALEICDAIDEFGDLDASGEAEVYQVNMADVYAKAAAASGEKGPPFDMNAFSELVKTGLADDIRAASEGERFTNLKLQVFLRSYPMLVLKNYFDVLNSRKRGEIEA